MTALTEYQRLESTGLWRENPQAQRREVFVSIGDATLVVLDKGERALSHWSLAAVVRANPGRMPAIYHPDGDPDETLELREDEAQMIDAIEQLRTAIEKRRPRPGRLRWVMALASITLVAGLAIFWAPGAIQRHALTVVPPVKRAEIGQALLGRISRVAGQPCATPDGTRALTRLGRRLLGADGGERLVVLRSGVTVSAHLPGGWILLNRALVEDPEEPDVVAGFVIAEALRAQLHDPLRDFLEAAGLVESFRLLTTGHVTDAALDAYAESFLAREPRALPEDLLIQAFGAARVRAAPYAYALDVSGETTVALIEADPFAATAPELVLRDADWLRLQGICEG